MLYIGTFSNCSKYKPMQVFNLSSFTEGLNLVEIFPKGYNGSLDNYDFDMYLYNYIFSNDAIFFEFFSKIIFNLYNGNDVYLVTNTSTEFEGFHDSVAKLIQSRYGYIATLINSEEDYFYSEELGFGNTGIEGVSNLDSDKMRYSDLVKTYDPRTFNMFNYTD